MSHLVPVCHPDLDREEASQSQIGRHGAGLSCSVGSARLLEDLSRDLDLRPGMRVLDLGSGMGATSVFLAREFGVEVVAVDLWVSPDAAAAVFADAGLADRVCAVKAEAHALPFARSFFDAVISIDAYEYFGTADSYLAYITRFLKAGGQLAIATPAMTCEVRDLGEIPQHIRACVGWEAMAWHTAEWWRFQWKVIAMLEADNGEFLSFALLAACKNASAP